MATNRPNKIIIHHTAGSGDFERVRNYHVEALLWSDIGYHFFIESGGTVKEGRAVTKQGAHCRGQNKSSIGIALQGDFTRHAPTQKQVEALWELIRKVQEEHQLSPYEVYGHCEFSDTQCPGQFLGAALMRE